MSLSLELKNYLKKEGASEVGFADITNFSPKEGLNSGVVFYIAYPKEICKGKILYFLQQSDIINMIAEKEVYA